jgi:hypothetical protein
MLNMKKKLVLFFLSTVIISLFFLLKNSLSTVSTLLQTMPPQDRQTLTDCFQELIENNCFGYTLFGNKPISVESYPVKLPHSISDFLQHRSEMFLFNSEKTWKKYVNFLKSDNFVVKFEKRGDYGACYLINRTAFCSAVHANLDLFKQVLGPQVTAESLLKIIEHKTSTFNKVIKRDVVLEGILLGYGRQNALAYQRYQDVLHTIKYKQPPPWCDDEGEEALSPERKVHALMNASFPIPIDTHIVPREGFYSLAEECSWFDEVIDSWHEPCFFRFPAPSFMWDKRSEETKAIFSEYKATKEKMVRLYDKGDFLEITLKQFMGEFS